MAVPTLTRPASVGERPRLGVVPDALSDPRPAPRPHRAEPAGRVAKADPADDPEYLATWFAYYLAALLLGLLGLGGLWIYIAL
jgi:hypothetical protein